MAQESGYIIEVSDNGTTGWAPLADLPAGTTSYQHTGLTINTTKYYRAKAKGNGSTTSDSPYTNVVSATVTDGALFSDNFNQAESTPDPAKWTRRGTTAQVTFSVVGNRLECYAPASAQTVNGYDNALVSVPSFGSSSLEFLLAIPASSDTTHVFYFGFEKDANNYVVLSRTQADVTMARFLIRVNGVNTVVDTAIGLNRYWRINGNGESYTLWHSLDGVTWTQEGGAQTAALGSERRVFLGMAYSNALRTAYVDDLKVTAL